MQVARLMTRAFLILTSLICLASAGLPAAAQEAQPVSGNVTAYPPSFFAQYGPSTAKDMIDRLPGFSFEEGSSARGFAGTAGNVLIDGQRPPSRGDSLSDVLSRLPASMVERIDLIRGDAPGIDMQGRSIIANVIRRSEAGLTGSTYGRLDIDGRGNLDRELELQTRRQAGQRQMEGALSYSATESSDVDFRERRLAEGTLDEFAVEQSVWQSEWFRLTGSGEGAVLGGRLGLNGQASVYSDGSDDVERRFFPGGESRSRSLYDETSGELGFRYTRTIGSSFGMELIGFQSLDRSTSRSQSVRPAFTSGSINDSKGGESIVSVAFHSPQYGAFKFDAGSEAAFNWEEARNVRTIDGEPVSLSGDQSRVEELRSDSHAVATWSPSPALNVQGGLRFERSTITAGPVEKTLNYWKPRLNVSWTPRTGHAVNLRLERLVDQLSFDAFQSSVEFNSELGETIFGVGNNDLEPALRYERRWSDEGHLTFEVVREQIDDYVARTIVASPTDPDRFFEISANTGKAERTRYSIDAGVPLDRYGFGDALLTAGVDFRTSELRDPVTPSLVRRSSGETPFSWNVRFSQTIKRVNLNWAMFADGGTTSRNYSPRSISAERDDISLGASFDWRPRPNLAVSGGVNNIGRGDDVERLYFYNRPRHVGSLDFIEDTFSPGVQSVFLSVRRAFL
jgi:hypothetical protein